MKKGKDDRVPCVLIKARIPDIKRGVPVVRAYCMTGGYIGYPLVCNC